MKAWIVGASGAELADVADPRPGLGQVCVRIEASALNRLDLKVAAGERHGATGGAGATLGIEWAGTISALGEGVVDYAVGDRVMGMGGGAFAEQVVSPLFRLSRIPAGMSMAEAVCYPVALRTMHNALVTEGGLAPGEAVLVQGASTGVGLLGLQMAKALGAGLVIGSSTTPERVARLGEFGADLAVNSRDESWVQAVLDATDGKGVDLVIDQVSGALLNQTLAATRILGRIINVGRLGGSMQPFNAELHAMRRISLIGVTFRTRTPAELADINTAMLRDIGPLLEAERFSIPIAARFAFADLPAALELMAANGHFGKIVIQR